MSVPTCLCRGTRKFSGNKQQKVETFRVELKQLSPKLVKEHNVNLVFLLRVLLASAPMRFLSVRPISSSNILLFSYPFSRLHAASPPPLPPLPPHGPSCPRPSHFQIRFSRNLPLLPLNPLSPLSPLLILTPLRSLRERSEAFPLPNSPRALHSLVGY